MTQQLFKKVNDNLQCLLCPNLCVLKNGQYGSCNTRKRKDNEIINPFSGIISSTSMDPVEKKPLYHFFPSSTIFSIGFFGCTLHCQFCQNYTISQNHCNENETKITPSELLEILLEKKINSIAFTYSEPALYFEWVRDTAKLCRENKIKTVLVTNGYLNKEPAGELLKYIDAANIDLKSGNDSFYKEICKGKLAPVKDFIKIAYDTGVHIELTTLVITDTNDSVEEMDQITDFIKSISIDIPFHISRYHPVYKMTKPATPENTINKLVEQAKQKLNFVYSGNIYGNSSTYCKKCNELLIQRNFYNTEIKSLDKNGNCKKCNTFNNFIL